MNITSLQRSFIKDKVASILPECRIYLFSSCNHCDKVLGDTDVIIFAERVLTYDEIEEIRYSLQKTFYGERLNIISHKNDFESYYTNYVTTEGEKL